METIKVRVSKSSSATHRTVQKSQTLNRKYVKRPTSIKVTSASSAPQKKTTTPHKTSAISQKTPAKKVLIPATRTSAKALKAVSAKDRAIQQALHNVATMEKTETAPVAMKTKHSGRRIFLAILCSAVTVGIFAFAIRVNMPDISVKVAAIQTGIEATYPTYIPRNYALSNVSSEKDRVVMYFDGPDNASFTLTEENSAWDSTAVQNNYAKKEFSAEYTTLREQGITVYVDGGNAAWVNGGILYTLKSTGKNLTKEQIRNLVISL